MRIPWWYGVAAATVVWLVGVLTLGWVPESTAVGGQVSDPLAGGMLLTWLAMPICIALDQRANSDRLAWAPATAAWILLSLVWFVNVVVGAAYCLRRHAAVRHAPPADGWASVVAGAVVAWVALIGLDAALPADALSSATVDGLAAVTVLAWMAMPLAVYLDAARVRGLTDWPPRVRGFVIATAIPFVNILAGTGYLYRRHGAFRAVDGHPAFDPSGVDTDNDGSSPTVSPWFRRAGVVFGVYFLGMVLVAIAAPVLSEAGLQVLGVLAWLPFGPVFAYCVYRDAGWRRDNDREVGDRWSWYLAAAVVQAAAFWYLLRRATKTTRHRSVTD